MCVCVAVYVYQPQDCAPVTVLSLIRVQVCFFYLPSSLISHYFQVGNALLYLGILFLAC